MKRRLDFVLMPTKTRTEPFSHRDRKALLVEQNSLVTTPIPRLDASIVRETKKSTNGRKKKYTPTKIKNKINEYFKWCEDEDELPSIKGMMIHLKMYKDQFYTYLTYPDFTDIMEHARLIISSWAESDVYKTKGLAAGKVAYMKNIHGWSDKLDTTNSTTVTRVVSVDEARAKIEMLAPKLLEMLSSRMLTDQLTKRPELVIEAEPEKVNRI